MDSRNDCTCPACGNPGKLVMSRSSYKIHNPFTKDGEGFSSVVYSKEEAKYRAKHNVLKYEGV